VKRTLHWPPSDVGVEAVGESFYRDVLAQLAGNHAGSSALVYFTAKLVPEADNTHDPNAVAIHFEGSKLAHLSRDDAVIYRAHVGTSATTADALITGGGSFDGVQYDYRLELLISLDTPPVARLRPRYSVPVRLHPQLIISVAPSTGRITVVAPAVGSVAASLCWPGVRLKAWAVDDLSDIHFFAPGSIGGSGRVAVISRTVFKHLSLLVEDADARVCFAGRNGVVFEFDSPTAE
jgi:hypothetical protein